MGTPAISVEGLIKDYGSFRALKGVDLAVEEGEIFGFLGPNGAGKTTMIRVLLDLLRPSQGRVAVLGESPIDNPHLRSRIGYLPGELIVPPKKTARECLKYFAALRGGRGADRIDALAEDFALDLDKQLRALSKGNKQKVGIIQAFMHDPELLILDEPTSGLDPLLQRKFLDLIHAATHRGATVFMSSHVLKEVEDVAQRVAILRAGQIVDIDSMDALRKRAGQDVLLCFDSEVIRAHFEGIPFVENLVVTGNEVRCRLVGEPDKLLRAASWNHVVRWYAKDRELEDLFMDFYRDEGSEQTPELDFAPSKFHQESNMPTWRLSGRKGGNRAR